MSTPSPPPSPTSPPLPLTLLHSLSPFRKKKTRSFEISFPHLLGLHPGLHQLRTELGSLSARHHQLLPQHQRTAKHRVLDIRVEITERSYISNIEKSDISSIEISDISNIENADTSNIESSKVSRRTRFARHHCRINDRSGRWTNQLKTKKKESKPECWGVVFIKVPKHRNVELSILSYRSRFSLHRRINKQTNKSVERLIRYEMLFCDVHIPKKSIYWHIKSFDIWIHRYFRCIAISYRTRLALHPLAYQHLYVYIYIDHMIYILYHMIYIYHMIYKLHIMRMLNASHPLSHHGYQTRK